MRVADVLKQWVVEQNLKGGDRLPAEADLVERFGMAKGTIREAMRILEAQGLIETRTGPGGGSFVGEVSAAQAEALLSNYFYFKNLTLAEIYQVRRLLEPELAAELAGRLTVEQLGELESIAGHYPIPPRSATQERAHHIVAMKFHAQLAVFAQNALLGFVIGFSARILSDLVVQDSYCEQTSVALWRKRRACRQRLLDALRSGSAESARRVMLEHILVEETMMGSGGATLQRQFVSERTA